MLEILSAKGRDFLRDCAKDAHNGKCPVTYGETHNAEDGSQHPIESILTHSDDHHSNQCLDYIFHLSRAD